MKPHYSDFFTRIMDIVPLATRRRFTKQISSRSMNRGTEKLVNLFVDCFDHHTRCSDQLPVNDLALLPQEDERRYISRDALFAHFLDKFYNPPHIFRSPYEEGTPDSENTIPFDVLCRQVQTFPITSDPEKSSKLGSNTFTYLVGEVGGGKSLLLASLYRRIVFGSKPEPYQKQDEHGYIIIPIYIDVDERIDKGGQLRQIDDEWFNGVVDRIIESIRGGSGQLEEATEINSFPDPKQSGYIQRFRKLTQFLARRKFRLLLLIDNVDRYHFHYTKHRFVPPYKDIQRESVIGNLKRLIHSLTFESEIGFCGLCVVFVCRDYVYDYLRVGCDDLCQPEREFGQAHRIRLADDYEVIRSRMAIFEHTVKLVLKGRRATDGQTFLRALKGLLSLDGTEAALRPEIALILKLGHHGYRSLVEFIDRLELDLSQSDVFERLLSDQPKNLPTLYILHLRQRYAQAAKHFPNIFLVDAEVAKVETFIEAYGPHRPTYWLKYFVMKVVASSESKKVSQLIRLFSKVGTYDEKLVRLIIGSLCSTNDSRCIDVDAASEIDAHADPDLLATHRGRQLVSKSNTFGHAGSDFCFEFNYLQLIIDDIWLSLPTKWADKVVVDLNYSYLFEPERNYGEFAWNMVRQKAYATSWFVAILTCSLQAEMKRMPHLEHFLEERGLMPDMKRVAEGIRDTCADILTRFKRPEEVKRFREFHQSLSSHFGDIEGHFETAFKLNVEVS